MYLAHETWATFVQVQVFSWYRTVRARQFNQDTSTKCTKYPNQMQRFYRERPMRCVHRVKQQWRSRLRLAVRATRGGAEAREMDRMADYVIFCVTRTVGYIASTTELFSHVTK